VSCREESGRLPHAERDAGQIRRQAHRRLPSRNTIAEDYLTMSVAVADRVTGPILPVNVSV
jgi:hypothetical protein